MKYAGSVTIVDDEGNIMHERELDADEMIEELLNTERTFEAGDAELDAALEQIADPEPAARKTRAGNPKEKGMRKKSSCGKCGEEGHNAKTCGRDAQGPVKTQVQEELDADARLRVKRMVEGGVDFDDIKKALKRADFTYSDREIEEMIAWAEHA